jgi:YVTN family beta-propeller protein
MQRELPNGTVTLLFTDIEGSTRLQHRLGDEYRDVVAKHRRLLESAFAKHGGIVVDRQTESFFVVFTQARHAVHAAADAQRALAEETWPDQAQVLVRMGLHSGDPEVAGDRYVGLAVSRAARICASAHGGQVLLSSSARALLSDHDRTDLDDLGAFRLKDFAEPEPISQLVVDGLPAAFPPLRTQAAPSRSRRPLLAAASLLLAALIAVAIFAFSSGGGAAEVAPNSVGVVDPERNRLIGEVQVGRRPDAVEVGEGSVWVANLDDETLSRIDVADTAARPTTISVDAYPSDIALGDALAWVALGTRGGVLSVDSAFNTVSDVIPVLTQACQFPHASVTLGGGFLWFACGTSGLVRMNPRSGAIAPLVLSGGSIEAGTLLEYPDFVDIGFAAGGTLWIVNRSGNSVIEVDTVSNKERRTVTVGRSPVAIAVSDKTLWVANFEDDTVTRVDVVAGKPAVTAAIPVGDGPVAVAVGEGAVWVANRLGHTLSRIDPENNDVVATVDVGNEPGRVAAGAGSVWVTVRETPSTTAES